MSRGAPEFGKERQGVPPFVKQRQWERRCKWAEQQEELLKQYKNSHKKVTSGHKTPEVELNSSTEQNQDDKTCKKDDEKAGSSADGTKRDVENDEAEAKSIDVSAVDDNKESNNIDNDIITLDSAEEDNGNKEDENIDNDAVSGETSTKEKADGECGKGDTKRNRPETYYVESVSRKRMLLVVPDSDGDNEQYLTNIAPRLEKEPFPVYESLHLTLEEAFFLSFGLGCLQVLDMFGICLTIDGMWQLFCESQKDFIQKYVAYHYFRSKGWVVKPGIKFGSDFCKLLLVQNNVN